MTRIILALGIAAVFAGSAQSATITCASIISGQYNIDNVVYFPDNSISVTEGNNPATIRFSTDGTKAYIWYLTENIIHQYKLNTPFDIRTLEYDNKSFNNWGTPAGNSEYGLTFSVDGKAFFNLGVDSDIGDTAYHYILRDPWDISTAYLTDLDSKVMTTLRTGTEEILNAQTNIFFATTGKLLLLVDTIRYTQAADTPGARVRAFDIAVPFVVATAEDVLTSDQILFSETTDDSLSDVWMDPSGQLIYSLYYYTGRGETHIIESATNVPFSVGDSFATHFTVNVTELVGSGGASFVFVKDCSRIILLKSNGTIYQLAVLPVSGGRSDEIPQDEMLKLPRQLWPPPFDDFLDPIPPDLEFYPQQRGKSRGRGWPGFRGF